MPENAGRSPCLSARHVGGSLYFFKALRRATQTAESPGTLPPSPGIATRHAQLRDRTTFSPSTHNCVTRRAWSYAGPCEKAREPAPGLVKWRAGPCEQARWALRRARTGPCELSDAWRGAFFFTREEQVPGHLQELKVDEALS